MIARGRHEADYSVEGMGTRQMDPLEEYRLEEERLHNLKSPYNDNLTEPRMVVKPSGKHPYVKGKPPTPPPRERSRTPPSPRRMSPVGRKGAPASVQHYGRQTPPVSEVPCLFFSLVRVTDPLILAPSMTHSFNALIRSRQRCRFSPFLQNDSLQFVAQVETFDEICKEIVEQQANAIQKQHYAYCK